MSFLTAEWRKLAIANYEIAPKVLENYLPYKTELDLWEGVCYASLVGFMFVNTKVMGLKIPFHVNFEEVNLRFYVRHFHEGEWRRGVVFIKEIVPLPAITFVANTVYREHYQTMKMQHRWEEVGARRHVEYSWKAKGDWQNFKVIADKAPSEIEEGSETEFITQHFWGYTKINEHKTFEYEVTHSKWKHFPVREFDIKVDFEKVYGKDFEFLNHQKPKSVMLAEGSKITVENKRKI